MPSADTLPGWPGADHAYAQAQTMLKSMVTCGHVEIVRNGRGKPIRSVPSAQMDELIAAMNDGNETQLKGLLAHGRSVGLL